MKNRNKRILALLMAFALILQYSFSASFLSVYAEGEEAQVEVTQSEAKAAEEKSESAPAPEPEPAPAAEEKSEPAPAPEPAPAAEEKSESAPAVEAEKTESEPAASDGEESAEQSGEQDAVTDEAASEESADASAENADADNNQADSADGTAAAEGEVPAEGEDVLPEEELLEEELEEEPEEEEYPAVTLTKSAGGVTVTLKAGEGVLPKGVDMHVSRVTRQDVLNAVEERLEAEGKTLTDAVAIDVTPVDKNGEPVQPIGSVSVTFSGTGLDVGDGGVDVFRVSDSASSVTEMGTSVATSNKQTFSTNHFTIYVAGGSQTDPKGQTIENRYEVEYGTSITLNSTIPWYQAIYSQWEVVDGTPGTYSFNANSHVFRNANRGEDSVEITVRHRYRQSIFNNWRSEYFYISALPATFTVQFMLQDAKEDSFSHVEAYDQTVHWNGTATDPSLPATKEVDGKTYKFYGWWGDSEGSTAAVFDNIQDDKTYYGRYATTAKIHFNKNTSDAASVPDDIEDGAGNKVTLRPATRSGYTFAGWNTIADGSGTSYQAGESIKMPAEGLTLYAQWSNGDENKMVIHYHDNYSLGYDVIHSEAGIRKNWQTTLWDEIPSRPSTLFVINYVFRGWATSRDADAPEYYPGETFHTGDDNVELYAVWGLLSFNELTPLTANSDTVTYDGKEHTVSGVTGGTPWASDANYVKVGDTALFGIDIFANVAGVKAVGTDAGHYATSVSAPLYYLLGSVMTRLFDNPFMNIEGGMLVINPAEITISTDGDVKVYDGEELTAGGKVTFTEDGEEKEVTFAHDGEAVTLFNGEKLNLRTIGSQTEIGESDNAFELDWGKPDDWGDESSTASKFNYKIIEGSMGKLIVKEAFTVKFVDEDGTLISEKDYPEGTAASEIEVPADPTKAADSENTYEFAGWTPEIADVTADATYTATYKATPIPKPEPEPTPEPTPTPTPSDVTPEETTPTPAPAANTEDADEEDDDDDDDNAGGGGNNAGGGNAANAAAAAAVIAGDDNANPPAAIVDDPVPQAEPEVIEDADTPQSAPENGWALLNLIAMVGTAAGAILAFLRKREDETASDGTAPKLAGGALGIASIATFLLTENLSGAMTMTDKWTALMAGMLAAQAVTAALAKRATEASEEDDAE